MLKQSTVATVLVGPLLDASGVAVTNAVIGDFNLTKNGTTAALAAGATALHNHNGHYLISFIVGNVDTLGRLIVSANNAAHAMTAFRFQVAEANVFDSLFGGGDLLKVDVTEFGNLAGVFAAGIPEAKVASIAASAITEASLAASAITALKANVAATAAVAGVAPTAAIASVANTASTAPTAAVAVVAAVAAVAAVAPTAAVADIAPTAAVAAVAAVAGAGGGGSASLANQVVIIDMIDAISAAQLAALTIDAGTISSFPEQLVIGDSYTANTGQIRISITDADGDPIESFGSLDLSDAVVSFTAFRPNDSAILTGTAEYFSDSSGTYVLLSLPSSETIKGKAEYTYEGRLKLSWEGVGSADDEQKTYKTTPFKFVANP